MRKNKMAAEGRTLTAEQLRGMTLADLVALAGSIGCDISFGLQPFQVAVMPVAEDGGQGEPGRVGPGHGLPDEELGYEALELRCDFCGHGPMYPEKVSVGHLCGRSGPGYARPCEGHFYKVERSGDEAIYTCRFCPWTGPAPAGRRLFDSCPECGQPGPEKLDSAVDGMRRNLNRIISERQETCDHVLGRKHSGGGLVQASQSGVGSGGVMFEQFDFCPRCGMGLTKEIKT